MKVKTVVVDNMCCCCKTVCIDMVYFSYALCT